VTTTGTSRKSINSAIPETEFQRELERIYSVRFTGIEDYRNRVWRVLISDFFSHWIAPESAVLDVGCGYGEFINNVIAGQKYGMDLNPSARERLHSDVRLLEQDCSAAWPLQDNSLDVVFTSNFFEHLPTKAALQGTLLEAQRCLRRGGRIITLGPNVKYLSGSYWDFFDHHLPLTELSLSEAMIMAGLEVEQTIPKFLPYSMCQGLRPPVWTLKAYLRFPLAWRFFGKQFLVIARKSS
jgi:SAM-dependent methyltransferase